MARTGWKQSQRQKDAARAAQFKHGEAGTRDGKKATREYIAWSAMKSRCYWKKFPQRKDYNKRGIKVCRRWRNNYIAFLADMGRCPAGLTLERINNNGNYEPRNCRWDTRSQQSKNQRHGWRKRKRNEKGQFQ